MTALSDRMAKVTTKLVTKYGADAVMRREYPGTFDPATQIEISGGSHTDEVKAVIEEYKAHEVDGDLIRYGDKKILVPLSDLVNLVEPKSGDIIEINDSKYRVINSMGVSAGDKSVGFSIQARK